MWGSSFTDWAKKAQEELQEQAAHLTVATPSSLFNLDAMQQEEDEAATAKAEVSVTTNDVNDTGSLPPPVTTSWTSPLPPSLSVPRVHATSRPKPSLLVPSAVAEQRETLRTSTDRKPPQKMSLPEATTGALHAPVRSHADGWEENLDSHDLEDETPATVDDAADYNPQSVLPDRAAVMDAPVAPIAGHQPIHDTRAHDELPRSDEDRRGDGHDARKADDETSPRINESDEDMNDDDHDNFDDKDEGLPSVHKIPLELPDAKGQSLSDPATPTASVENLSSVENVVDLPHDASNPVAAFVPAITDPDPTTTSNGTLDAVDADLPATRITSTVPLKKLLVLCSMNSLNKTAHKRQERAFTILHARQILYDVVDGADPQHKSWREELFTLAHAAKGEYPQFFLMDVDDGSTTYWGPWDRLEYANDNGNLAEELTGRLQTGWSPEDHVVDSALPPSRFATHQNASAVAMDDEREQFSQQMQRVEVNHAAERQALETEHARALEQALASTNHDACITERVALQEKYETALDQKNDQLHDLVRVNEGYKLKLEVLQREVTGTQQLLQARDGDLGQAAQAHHDQLVSLQSQLVESSQRATEANEQVESLKAALETSLADLAGSKQELADLKARVKVVATELKDRRVECRELHTKADELNAVNLDLKSRVDELKSQLTHQNRNGSEKQEEMEQLKVKLVDAAIVLEQAENRVQEAKSEGEKALADYKRKAQNSLSMANARTAAAVQAKEEAELEARAARSTADSSMDRAVKAEIASREALAEAKAYVAAMEKEKSEAIQKFEAAGAETKSAQEQAAKLQEDLSQAVESNSGIAEQLRQSTSRLESEQERSASLREELSKMQHKIAEVQDDSAILRAQLKRSESELTTVKESMGEGSMESKPVSMEENGVSEKATDNETIRILQEELQDANAAIEEMKDALKSVVEMNGSVPTKFQLESTDQTNYGLDGSRNGTHSNGGNDATPLFFAMEKQAELKTARNEINRLANILADVQSEKMEAVDAMEDMRRKMEESESKLNRFEKLMPIHDPGNTNGTCSETNSGATNIEYLKNIMLSFLNAKTAAEKKNLVPVIGAVLCLTPHEQAAAAQNIDQATSLGGVGQSLFESLSGRLS